MGATAFSSAVAGHLPHGENDLMKLKSADRKIIGDPPAAS